MNDKDYKELLDFVAGHFTQVYSKLDYLIENKADKEDFRQLQQSVDDYAKKADTYFQEMAALGIKVDRLEKWLYKVAEKVGIKLD